MSILGNNISDDSFANSNSANNYNKGVLLRPSTNSNFDGRNTADNRPLGAPAVSWGAVFAGTVAAAAISLLLIILGAGLGMSSASVFSGQSLDATTLGITTIIWLAVTQIIAYSMGGHLAGRLRTKTVSIHTDEVHFRDTAHGFLTWALSSLLCVTF